MIAFAAPRQQTGQQPLDTGCVFPFGVGGRDVRLRLLTDDPAKALACGIRLKQWGLPLVPEIIALPSNKGVFALDLLARPVFYPELARMGPPQIKFGGDNLILETLEPENIRRFARWYDEKARATVAQKKPKAPSLSDLADAGAIETFDAG